MKIKSIKVDNFKSLVNDLPRMREKLTVMGAGEVYEDTLLTQLNAEILGAD